MTHGVFIHRTDSIYDDVPSERYQFPKQYLGRVRKCEGDWIVYLEPGKVKNTRGYFAVARVQEIIPDPRHSDMYLAVIEKGSYLDFGDPVRFRDGDTIVERGLLNAQGKISGRAQAAVRPIAARDFARIVERGLGQQDDILPRTGEPLNTDRFEETQSPFGQPEARVRTAQLSNRALRDRNFRKTVLRAYRERCAVTGLRLINGRGRAEAEAAHIRPVEQDGPDIVSNGIALSGTAHWMFDRGMIGLSDDLSILVSRQSNNIDAVTSLINDSGHLIAPNRLAERPHVDFVQWHREHCFKT